MSVTRPCTLTACHHLYKYCGTSTLARDLSRRDVSSSTIWNTTRLLLLHPSTSSSYHQRRNTVGLPTCNNLLPIHNLYLMAFQKIDSNWFPALSHYAAIQQCTTDSLPMHFLIFLNHHCASDTDVFPYSVTVWNYRNYWCL